MSELVGNPEDRFSRVAAHMLSCTSLLVNTIILLFFEDVAAKACASVAFFAKVFVDRSRNCPCLLLKYQKNAIYRQRNNK